MLETIKKQNRLFWTFRKLHLMRYFEYQVDHYFWMVISFLWTIFNIFFFSILVNINGDIAGWSEGEMYMLMGVFSLIDAFTWSFFYHNMHRYAMMIYEGGLSGILVKPVDTQFIIMTQSNNYTNISRFILGFFTLVYGIKLMGISPSLVQISLFTVLFINSLLFIYFLWFTITTIAFWVKRLQNINEVIPSLRRIFQLPRSVFSGLASTFFTVLVPLGLVGSIPTESLLADKFSASWSLYFIGATIVLIVFSRWFFFKSIKKYSGVGS